MTHMLTVEHEQSSRGSATFSDCRTYRYLLTRSQEDGEGSCMFILLNPSTADASRDDPTVRRCSRFAFSMGFRELRLVNLFALMTADPRQIAVAQDAIGPENDATLERELRTSDFVIVGWGNHGRILGRSGVVRAMIHRFGNDAFHLGLNRTGEPRHPLYVPANVVPSPLRGQPPVANSRGRMGPP